MPFFLTLQRLLIAFTTPLFCPSLLVLASCTGLEFQSLVWKDCLHTCPGCPVPCWPNHLRSTQESVLGLQLFLHYFTDIFASHNAGSGSPLCRRHNAVSEGLLRRIKHPILSAIDWSVRLFAVNQQPPCALQQQQISRAAHWLKTQIGSTLNST